MTNPINLPAGYAPTFAMGFSSDGGELHVVRTAAPLPVQNMNNPAGIPLSGETSTSLVAGPFTPVAGRPVMITLSGAWTGTVALKRSTDAGATLLPLTLGGTPWGAYAANACEPVWSEDEEAATLYLDIALASGTLAYRLAQ